MFAEDFILQNHLFESMHRFRQLVYKLVAAAKRMLRRHVVRGQQLEAGCWLWQAQRAHRCSCLVSCSPSHHSYKRCVCVSRKYNLTIPESNKDALLQENASDAMAIMRLPLLGLVPVCFVYAADRDVCECHSRCSQCVRAKLP